MGPLQEVLMLKIERRKASEKRKNEIDLRVRALADDLSHDEAAFIVKKYEKDVLSS